MKFIYNMLTSIKNIPGAVPAESLEVGMLFESPASSTVFEIVGFNHNKSYVYYKFNAEHNSHIRPEFKDLVQKYSVREFNLAFCKYEV